MSRNTKLSENKNLKISKKEKDIENIDNNVKMSSKETIKFVIVEKNGDLRNTEMKEFNVEEIYKKCKFKKSDGFEKKTEWAYNVKNENKFIVGETITFEEYSKEL